MNDTMLRTAAHTRAVSGVPAERKPRDIESFCDHYAMCKSQYFKMRARGDGPAELRVGRKVLITPAAEDEWAARHTVQPVARQPE